MYAAISMESKKDIAKPPPIERLCVQKQNILQISAERERY